MNTKLRLVFSITIAFLSFYGSAQSSYWQQDVSKQGLNQNFSERFDVQKGRVFAFNEQLFRTALNKVSIAKSSAKIIYFPNAAGESVAFKVTEQPVFSPELSRKYPNIKSYAGYALGSSKDKIRFSVSHNGIQSMIVHADKRGSTFMQKDSNNNYVVYSRDLNTKSKTDFLCSTKATIENKLETRFLKPISGQELRKFRLAVSTTGEYTEYHGGTVADALAAINATVTRINQVFETDLAIRLELVSNTDQVIFTDPLTDPYSGSLSAQIQAELTNTIGEANYDIGILFNKAPGDGNAGSIGAVCRDGRKGSAYASTQIPEGDFFDLDFVGHEMGHQFGANHTWSFESEGTAVQVEPGSGTTIMGYAGIAGVHNVAANGEDYFHYASIVQISEYVQTISCGETISLSNSPPVVSPAGVFTIPVSTAFVLTGEAIDSDTSDVLSYTWEQIDSGIVPQAAFGPTNPIGANFRSQKPNTSPIRYFPKLSSVVSGRLTQTQPAINSAWETVSDIEREMNFAFTVRDNALGGGQVVSDLVNVFVESSAGPFTLVSHATNLIAIAGAAEEIVWNVANTEKAPINAQTVDIFLSTDGGDTFPILLAEEVSNDGSHMVQLPENTTAAARIMVKAHNNIFFAVNSSDFVIQESELILNFEKLDYEVCKPDVLVVPFSYETYLGFNEEATFSIVAPPSGLGINIFPETSTATNTAVGISFTDTQNLAVGSYPIRVLATTGSLTKEITFDLKVYDASFSEVVLITPAEGEIDISTNSELVWQADDSVTAYDIEIAEDEVFSSVIETGSVFSAAYSPQNLDNLRSYYWRVKPKNSCGEGVFGVPFSFTTIAFSCQNEEALDLPIVIAEIGTPKVVSKISVYDDLSVADINVNLKLDHSFLSDIVVTLTSPAGTTVVLISNSCDDLINVDATFDDDAIGFVCGGTPAVSGTVKPLGSLGSFNGESTLGEWVLTVSDNAPNDGGSLREFTLDICAEGEFRPDADNDGVFDDGADLCLDTPEGSQVNTSGCPVLVIPASNYSIEARSETCRSSNDGAIVLQVLLGLTYTVRLTGNGVNSTEELVASSLRFDTLSAGAYRLCITGTDGILISSEQCFDILIEEPEILSVSSKASLDGSIVDLELEGALVYNVELNGVVSQTWSSAIRLNLKAGLNILKVSTNLPCQGSYDELFLFSENPLVYPNPFDDFLTVFFGTIVGEVSIKVFDANGRFVLSSTSDVNSSELELDLSVLATGIYFIQFEAESIKGTSKVIKR